MKARDEAGSTREPGGTELGEQIRAARYQLYLPTEEELRATLTREREEAERAAWGAPGVLSVKDELIVGI